MIAPWSTLMRIIVTGASSGIGRAVAHHLTERGDQVAITARRRDRLAGAAEKLPLAGWAAADATHRQDVTGALVQLTEALGGIDGLVHCAGAHGTPVSAVPLDAELERAWDESLAVNLKSAWLWATAAAAEIRGPGTIVLMSSVGAYSGGSTSGGIAYAAAKAGVTGLVRALSNELSPRQVTVNAIAPGYVADTEFFGDDNRAAQARRERISAQVPAGRPGTPQEIAAAAGYLTRPETAYVTGQVLHVNGGWYHAG